MSNLPGFGYSEYGLQKAASTQPGSLLEMYEAPPGQKVKFHKTPR